MINYSLTDQVFYSLIILQVCTQKQIYLQQYGVVSSLSSSNSRELQASVLKHHLGMHVWVEASLMANDHAAGAKLKKHLNS